MGLIKIIWNFIQNQVLGMQWLKELIGNGLTEAGLDVTSRLGGSIQFFIYDILKITILLCLLIFVISYIQRNEVRRFWGGFMESVRIWQQHFLER